MGDRMERPARLSRNLRAQPRGGNRLQSSRLALAAPELAPGIASEAAQAILDRALFTLGLDPVVALVHPENQASICVAAKIGMRYSGLTSFRGAPQLIYRADALRGGKARSGNRVTTTKLKR